MLTPPHHFLEVLARIVTYTFVRSIRTVQCVEVRSISTVLGHPVVVCRLLVTIVSVASWLTRRSWSRVSVAGLGGGGASLDGREEQRQRRQNEEQRHLRHAPEIANNGSQVPSSWKPPNTRRRITSRRDQVCFEE